MTRKHYLAIDGIPSGSRTVRVTGDEYHHLVHVIRARTGGALTVLDGSGGVYEATVERIGRGEAVIAIRSRLRVEAPPPIDMALALTKANRFDMAVEKCTEIGVRRFVPFIAERSVWRGGAEEDGHKRERLHRKVVAACKQSARSHFPAIGAVCDVASLIASFGDYAGVYLADRGGTRHPPRLPAAAPGSVLGVVGPEGGLSERERGDILSAGASAVSLGPVAIRSETAAICLLFRLHDLYEEGPRPEGRD